MENQTIEPNKQTETQTSQPPTTTPQTPATPPPTQPHPPHKSSKWLIPTLIIAVLIISLGIAGFFAYQ